MNETARRSTSLPVSNNTNSSWDFDSDLCLQRNLVLHWQLMLLWLRSAHEGFKEITRNTSRQASPIKILFLSYNLHFHFFFYSSISVQTFIRCLLSSLSICSVRESTVLSPYRILSTDKVWCARVCCSSCSACFILYVQFCINHSR